MPHFLIKKENIKTDIIKLENNENFFHITKVLRSKVGEKIKFIDENQVVYYCKIIKIEKNNLEAQIIEQTKTDRILKNNICLIQSILAQDAQNLAIANAVQTGVKEIYPVISDNVSVSKKNTLNKIEKWQKIAMENFKQCERGDCVKIKEITSLKEALLEFEQENILIFAEKDSNISIDKAVNNINKDKKIAIVIGPEGGFSQEEFIFFKNQNYKLISLGKMIYKAPNAIVAGVSNIVSRIEHVC